MPTVLEPVQTTKVSGNKIPEKIFDFKNIPQRHSNYINAEKLKNEGIVEYRDLSGYTDDGVQVLQHKILPESRLKLERNAKIVATAGAVGLNTLSALGLFYSGARLFFSSFGMGDVDESYRSLGKAYSASAVAGALTGAAHESGEWAVGNIGMGVFSQYLDNMWGLAGFSISEGLAAIGMGKVRYRDNRNVSAVRHSLFNNPKLENFRFLMPIEQSIVSFGKRFASMDGWKRLRTEEPYSLFQSAGGGLISAGGILTIASLFKEKLSERMQSIGYLPYSIFSIMNLIAFFRDGEMQLQRSTDFGARKKGELYSMRSEGYLKKAAAPVLAINNALLALKGLGLDTQGGTIYNMAMAVRSWGAGLAFLAFKSQSLLKFFKPDMFGPRYKEVFKIMLNPLKYGKKLLKHLDKLEAERPPEHISDTFDAIIYDGSNKQREIIDALINTKTFQLLRRKTQIGLPTPSQPLEGNRGYLERFNHSKRVCAIGLLIYDALVKNTTDPELKQFLLDNEDAFRLSGLLHDVGHIARSHLAEQAVEGHDNDEHTIDILKDPDSDIHQTIVNHYGKEKGEKILKQTRDIIGKWSPLFKAFKIADYTEYLRCGDFSCTEGFPLWNVDEVKAYVDQIRLFKNGNGEINTGFTEEGALTTFVNLFDRKVYNDTYNFHPLNKVEEMPYLLGLAAADVSSTQAKEMTEPDMDKAAISGLDKLKGSQFQFRVKHITGGETAYSGYSQVDPGRKIYVVFDDNRKPMEVIDYIEQYVKPQDGEFYKDMKTRINCLTIPKEVDLTIKISAN